MAKEIDKHDKEIHELTAAHFQGPLPPPSLLKEYDAVLPGLAERIVAMAEKQSDHRQQLEKRIIHSETTNSLLGIIAGVLLSLVFGVLSYGAIIKGQPVAGSILGGTTLVSLVSVFIYGTNVRKKMAESDKKNSK